MTWTVMKPALAVIVRPWLWPSVARFVPSRWWAHAPYLPVPSREWLEFRLVTAYGSADARPTPAELVAFLTWCRGAARESRRRR